MAWRSSGTTNDEMVDNLKRFGVISTPSLEQSFRNVDRQIFVPARFRDAAHMDKPVKDGNVHISAPHIYGSALEALELRPSSSLSFLNIGSGTGYISCIVADVLGVHSSHYGLDIHRDVVEYSRDAIQTWKDGRVNSGSGVELAQIQILHGNALQIDLSKGEAAIGFDRIYVGAAVEQRHVAHFMNLLRPGGILVGPVEDELVKVIRIGKREKKISASAIAADSSEFIQQVLSGVRFAPLVTYPKLEVEIPSQVWDPKVHQYYPDAFRAVCKELLMCSQSDYYQPPPRVEPPQDRVNLSAVLPKVIWMEIMSFTHRSWFEPPQTDEAFLRRRVLEEQAETAKANQARREAEARLQIAERERDVYRIMARRWQSRLQTALWQQTVLASDSDGSSRHDLDIDDAAALLLSERGPAAVFGLGSMVRYLQSDDEAEESAENSHVVEENRSMAMEEDDDDDSDSENFDEALRGDEDFEHSSDDDDIMEESDDGDEDAMAMSPGTFKTIASRPQTRTVSISSEDI